LEPKDRIVRSVVLTPQPGIGGALAVPADCSSNSTGGDEDPAVTIDRGW